MSQSKTVIKKCPKCGKEFETTMWESVNADLNPELAERIKEGSFFHEECPVCGEDVGLYYPVLYHDMSHKFMVRFDKTRARLYEFRETIEKPIEALGICAKIPGYRYAGSTSYADWVSTIVALENDLDVRVVKMVMVYLRTKLSSKTKRVEDLLLDGKKNKEGELQFVVIFKDKIKRDYGQGRFPLSKKLYEYVKSRSAEDLKDVDDFIFDMDDALALIKESIKKEPQA